MEVPESEVSVALVSKGRRNGHPRSTREKRKIFTSPFCCFRVNPQQIRRCLPIEVRVALLYLAY